MLAFFISMIPGVIFHTNPPLHVFHNSLMSFVPFSFYPSDSSPLLFHDQKSFEREKILKGSRFFFFARQKPYM